MSIPTTTLARIRAHNPCETGYKQLCKGLGGIRTYGKDTPITVRQIVEINGLDDALWCLRTMPEHDRRWLLLAVRYARRVQHLMTDPRSLKALDVAERHARGLATDEELAEAETSAGAAAWAARAAGAAAEAAWAARAARAAAETAWLAARAAVAAVEAAEAAGVAERKWQAEELIRISEEEM